MILEFKTPAEADEVADPKHVWIDGNRVVVYTGDDIPPPPPAAIEYVEKALAIKALRTAGVKDDATADAALKTAETATVAAPVEAIKVTG